MKRVFKCAGLLACTLLASTIVLSRWWSFAWTAGNYWGFVQWGGIAFGYHNSVDAFRWLVSRNTPPGLYFWLFEHEPGNQYGAPSFITPLWLPLAAIGLTTIVVWRRGLLRLPGTCQKCGYNLTGNVSGVCPECGMPTSSK